MGKNARILVVFFCLISMIIACEQEEPQPTITLMATQESLDYGGTITISWTTTNASTCISNGGGGTGPTGTFTIPPLLKTTTFSVMASGRGGTATSSIT